MVSIFNDICFASVAGIQHKVNLATRLVVAHEMAIP
jgi:hypothetical protein